MKKTLKITCLGLLAACCFSITACNTDRRTIITYLSWDYGTEAQNNEERQLIAAYEEAHPDIHIKVVENVASGNFYWDQIKASVFNGIDLPDVFMIPNMDWPLAAGYLLDIKDMTDADPEFAKVPASVRDACTFKSGVYCLPCRLNLQGYFMNVTVVNRDLGIETRNINCNSEYSVIENIVNTAYNDPTICGLNSAAHFIDTQASVNDTTGNLGYFTWDGSAYHLDNSAFISGVQQAKAMFAAGKTLDAYDEEARLSLGLDPEIDPKVDAWNKGKLALRYGYTYEMPDMLQNNTLGHSYKFIGNPGGKITIVGDYYGIYKETKHPDLAYDFAKYMSFGSEGFAKRLEVYREKGSVNTLPLIDDEAVIERYFDLYGSSSQMSGLEEAFQYIQTKSMVEGVKVVPGFLSARQNKATGITADDIENITMFELLNRCVVGNLDITSYTSGATNINTIANKTYSDWMRLNGDNYE